MKDSKNLVIGLLCAVVCVMAVAYAAFSTTLNINGTATVTSTWDVRITAIDCDATAAANGVEARVNTESFTNTTATFDVEFNQPGDTGVCTVTIKNNGTLNAKVDGISVVATNADGTTADVDSDLIRYSVTNVNVGDQLAKSAEMSYVINMAYHDVKDDNNNSVAATDKTKSKSLTVTIDYVQDFAA